MFSKSSFAFGSSDKRKNILTVKTDTSDKRVFNSPNHIQSKKISDGLPKKYQKIDKQPQLYSKQLKLNSLHRQQSNLAKKRSTNQSLFNDNSNRQIIQKQMPITTKLISEPRQKKINNHLQDLSPKYRENSDKISLQLSNTENNQFSLGKQNFTKLDRISQHIQSDRQKKGKESYIGLNNYKSQSLVREGKIIEASQDQNEQEMQNKQSLVIIAQDMISSGCSSSINDGKFRKCLSVEFKPKEKKMKLRDYLYIKSISGIRKKVIVNKNQQVLSDDPPRSYVRIRQYANDSAIENKIKSQIEVNINQIMSKLQVFANMSEFKGDKFMLNNLSNIIKDKIGKGCDQIQQLIYHYQQKLV